MALGRNSAISQHCGNSGGFQRRRQLFREAAQRAREEFEESIFRAFWRTAVEEATIEAAAKQLGKSTGAVYAARSRVLKRLRELVQELECDFDAEL